jgi:RimJ/RimL family protein N-acetyltransferase
MTLPVGPDIVPIKPEHIEGCHRAIDSVARERKYLSIVEAFPLEQMRPYILSLIEKGDPMFVALVGDEVVGWCDIRRDHIFPAYAHRGVLGMGIVSGHRSRGLGHRLLDTALKFAFSQGLTRVELEVRGDNSRAIALYQKIGFAREGVIHNAMLLDGEYHDSLSMAIFDK